MMDYKYFGDDEVFDTRETATQRGLGDLTDDEITYLDRMMIYYHEQEAGNPLRQIAKARFAAWRKLWETNPHRASEISLFAMYLWTGDPKNDQG